MRNRYLPNHLVALALIIAVIGGIATTLLSHAATTAYMVPGTIAQNCSENVTSQLNAWIASVPNNSTLQFAGGCFRIDQTLSIIGRSNLTLDGQGATFKTNDPTGDSSGFDAAAVCAGGSSASVPSRAARTRMQWTVTNSSNITFQQMTVVGANPCGGTGSPAYVADLEAQHAFNIDGGNTNVTIHDITATDVYGDFVYLRDTTNAHIYNSHFERNGRQGISVTSGGPVLIENNYLGNTRRATFDLEPNTSVQIVSGVTIKNNTIGAGRLLFIAAHGSGPVNNVLVEGNTLQGRAIQISVQGSATLRRNNWVVQDNNADTGWGSTGPASPIYFGYVDTVRVLNNHQPVQSGRGDYGVDISASTDVQVKNNYFVGAIGALYGYNNWSGSSAYLACSNKLTSTGNFDQPSVCPVAPPSTPPTTPASGGTQPGSSTPTSTQTGSSTQSPSTASHSSAPTSGSPVVDNGGRTPQPSATSPVQAISNTISSVTDPHQPVVRRLSISFVYWLLLAVLLLLGLWLIKHKATQRQAHMVHHELPEASNHRVIVGHFEPSQASIRSIIGKLRRH